MATNGREPLERQRNAPLISRRFVKWCTTILMVIAAVASHPLQASANDAFDPITGYRVAHYRAAVPETVPGGTRVNRDQVDELIVSGAILVDVMAAVGAGPHAETGEWQLAHGHRSIPGATWLPDVGRGHLKPTLQKYLSNNLAQLTAGDRAKPLIIFCQADCWMGWNAVQRIAKLGYRNIYWYPEGTDGWLEWGDRELTLINPVPLPPANAHP